METVLIRTGSIPVHASFLPGSPRLSLSGDVSPRISLHLEVSRRNDTPPARTIRRALSESNVIRPESAVSGGFSRLGGVGSRSLHTRIPVEEEERGFDRSGYFIPVEELGFSGDGIGKGRKSSGGGGGSDGDNCGIGGGNADRSKIGAYYQEMLKSNPTNSLLLRNYGKFLQEVERDMVKAEEYYGRSVLASPGDGEVLSLYGNLIWETQRDEVRAKSYFEQAVQASPDDCAVLGSYARFMWEAEEEEEDIKDESSAAIVAAF